MTKAMYPSYDHADSQGCPSEGHLLTLGAMPAHDFTQGASTAAGKSLDLFNQTPDSGPNEWRYKNREEWSKSDVFNWIVSVAQRHGFSYEDVNASAFQKFNGEKLLKLSKQHFEQADPQYGPLLYKAFESYPSDFESHTMINTQSFKQESMDSDTYIFPDHVSQSALIAQPDSESSNCESEPPKKVKRPPGRPPGAKAKAKAEKKTGRLWEFIRNLLHNPQYCPSVISWENHDEGVFRFVKSDEVARIWGSRKNNTKMNYEKLSRAMRYYYKRQVFLPVLGRKLVYKFGPNAKGWRSENPNFRHPH